jgi:hypothetical protein
MELLQIVDENFCLTQRLLKTAYADPFVFSQGIKLRYQ